MVLQYHGVNASLFEVLHHTGLGYSLAARPRIVPTITDDFPFPVGLPRSLKCWCGQETSLGEEDAEFLAQMYGLSSEFRYPEIVINREKCWQEYWYRVKTYISQDLPVCTNIDFTIFPYYVDLWNLSGKAYHYSHNILIVGFDDLNKTVFYHDPLCAALTSAKDGTYAPVSLEAFKRSVQSVHWLTWNGWEEGYTTIIFRKTGEPLSEETIFTHAHNRNIKRMRGCPDAYDKQSARENYRVFGIHALQAMQRDFSRVKTRLIMPIYPFKFSLINSFLYTAREKYNVSQYLLDHTHLSPICEHDAFLLQEEVEYWNQLITFLLEIHEIATNNSYVVSVLLSRPILLKISTTIGEIISIEKSIIEQPLQ
jgi:hypothetical protein